MLCVLVEQFGEPRRSGEGPVFSPERRRELKGRRPMEWEVTYLRARKPIQWATD